MIDKELFHRVILELRGRDDHELAAVLEGMRSQLAIAQQRIGELERQSKPVLREHSRYGL